MTIGGAATRDCTAYQLSAACIPLSGYVRLSPRERRAFTDGLPASFMRACYKIRQYTTECIREGVFHLSFVDLVFYPHVCSFSALAIRWRASAVLSFWAVRRRSPACHNYYRFVFRLIPFLGYSGERPRLRRACKHPLNSAKPLQQLHRRSETDCPSFRTARILSSSLEAFCSLCLMQLREQIALHVVHHARLAKIPPCCPWLKRFHTLPVRSRAAIRACLRCLSPVDTAFHSHCSVNVITPSPSCRLWSISACRAKDTPKE